MAAENQSYIFDEVNKKPSGVRIVITASDQLHKTATKFVAYFADNGDIEPYQGQDEYFDPDLQVKNVTLIEDGVLESLTTVLFVDYSLKSGTHVHLKASAYLSDEALENGIDWQGINQFERFTDLLAEKNVFEMQPIRIRDGRKGILVYDAFHRDHSATMLLGYENRAVADLNGKGHLTNPNSSWKFITNNYSPHREDFMLSLSIFQKIISHGTDAMYETFNMVPPNITHEIIIE